MVLLDNNGKYSCFSKYHVNFPLFVFVSLVGGMKCSKRCQKGLYKGYKMFYEIHTRKFKLKVPNQNFLEQSFFSTKSP